MVRLSVHVTPKAARDEVAGWRGGQLWVKVCAAPEGGKANAAVERVLAGALGIARSDVRVIRGQTARSKIVEVDGVTDEAVREAFGEPDPGLF